MKNQMILVMILILLHIVVCIVVTFHRKHVATVRRENVMPLVYAVPFFGAVCYGVRLYEDRRHRLGGRDTDMKPKDIMKGFWTSHLFFRPKRATTADILHCLTSYAV